MKNEKEVKQYMAKPELTKMYIAQTLKKIMATTDLDKISIQDIANECGINRKTFYYHFKDKQDLICWIFDNEFAGISDTNNNNTIIDELMDHFYSNKDFYVAALTSDAQNNLREHIFKVIHNYIITKVLKVLKKHSIRKEDLDMIANFFSYAIIGCMTQWAKEGMKTSPNEYNVNLHLITRECLEFIIMKYIA